MNSTKETTRLKIILLNAENLFLLFDHKVDSEILKLDELQWQKLSSSIFENKPIRKARNLAKIFTDTQADIVMLCEVGGLESLKNFNELFLNSEYSAALIEGNSDRNIDVGFLVRKTSQFYFDLMSNKNRAINFLYPHERNPALKLPSHKFSRDVAELKLFRKSADDPFLILMLSHLKSRLDHDGIDPQGFQRRKAELETYLQLYKETTERHPKTPILVAGDFNGNAGRNQTDEEFRKIYTETDLEDVLELAQIPNEQRATFYQIRHSGRADGRQIDFCFLSDKLKPHLKTATTNVFRYKYDNGFEIDTPQSIDAKLSLPSDHYPVIFELENLQIW